MKFLLSSKPLILGLLILLFIIPLSKIHTIVLERNNNLQNVERDISETFTGTQSLTGPWLLVDYELKGENQTWRYFENKPKVKINTPWQKEQRAWQRAKSLDFDSQIDVSSKTRGIYSVPVYTSHNQIEAQFSIPSLLKAMQEKDADVQLQQAYIAFELSDQRGLRAPPKIQLMGKTIEAKPGLPYPGNKQGFIIPVSLDLLATLQKSAKPMSLSIGFELNGTKSFGITPSADENRLNMSANWPHPKFSGAFLPDESNITEKNTTAKWFISSFATGSESEPFIGKPANWPDWRYSGIANMEIFEPVNIYTLNQRAIKYGLLFVILTFVGFYLFEVISKQNLHPIQYGLIGLSLCLFFLLLISSSEMIGFAWAYSLASVSCVALIGFYIAAKIGQKATLQLGGLLLSLYFAVFMILRLEDRALLVGSILIFIVLASMMFVTRQFDWYLLSQSASKVDTPEADKETDQVSET